MTSQGEIACSAAILATGGMSYPATGSTGDGYGLAQELGHKLVEPRGSLVPLVSQGDECGRMQGLSLRNVRLTLKNQKKKTVFEEQGELLFTHFGLSGPLALSASAHMQKGDTEQYQAIIDLKPALEEPKLEERLLRDFHEHSNQNFQRILEGLLPRLMISVMVEYCGIPGEMKVHSVTKSQRRHLAQCLKGFVIPLAGLRPVKEAIITAGGIKTGEIAPGSMMSKLVEGLFFAGELIDVDAYTGGFNLQIAWSTGWLAGKSAAQLNVKE